ncbi:efflux transporter outer membrane subunit [Variovorax ginsengisoli]|uniref:Efflux transporter outer membrane subunit n=1 Tax=Variovorax ginsengisoli TaxID=363844 RepID=A0ABT8S8B4_9BURK|nr:efflux transporter outer membrane subunit [Variovorax ginsengisoli]MDN8615297.1 efflux transporter outer membrane subunit [Variovorax ginsengisoli]MDO1534467.1 efflux transporter outer membrane subunit [Variovorax ginsengisoli]
MRILCLALAASLAGCAVGPDYRRPSLPEGVSAPAFKESGAWKTAAPATVDAAHPWWTGFGDPRLDALIEEANGANQSLRLAEAQYREAQALVQNAQAGWAPTLGLDLSGQRARSQNSTGAPVQGNTHAWSLQAAWEPDLWGRVRRAVEGAADSAQASDADLAAARLAVQAAVANDYIQLRMTDAQQRLYDRTIEAYRKSLQITRSQYRAGVVTRADVDLADTTLQSTQALALDTQLTRRQLEHAIAVLLGKTPSQFSIAADDSLPSLPAVPMAVPSELLERRPDIAGAERRAASANAGIGYAQAAYYPSLSLSAAGGFAGAGFGNWFAAPGKVWALGAAVAQNLFDGGQRNAQLAQARAAFDASSASYRQTVLAGFQEVEDNLAALDLLAQERQVQDGAVASARNAERVSLSQFRAGTTTYLAVITSQTLALNNERTALQLQSRQFAAQVALVKALGGGWDASQLQASADASPAAAHASSNSK